MSKELEIIKRWRVQIHWNKDFGWNDELDIIETALKRNIELEKANIELMEENTNLRERPFDFYSDVEKKLKAFEIIKNNFEISKPVGIDIENNKVSCGCLIQKNDLTQEKYDLLKEELL